MAFDPQFETDDEFQRASQVVGPRPVPEPPAQPEAELSLGDRAAGALDALRGLGSRFLTPSTMPPPPPPTLPSIHKLTLPKFTLPPPGEIPGRIIGGVFEGLGRISDASRRPVEAYMESARQFEKGNFGYQYPLGQRLLESLTGQIEPRSMFNILTDRSPTNPIEGMAEFVLNLIDPTMVIGWPTKGAPIARGVVERGGALYSRAVPQTMEEVATNLGRNIPWLVERANQVAGHVPGVEQMLGIVDPRMASQSPTVRAVLDYAAANSDVLRDANVATSFFGRDRWQTIIQDGRFHFPDGTARAVQDVLAKPGDYPQLPVSDRNLIAQLHEKLAAYQKLMDTSWTRLDEVNPYIAKRMERPIRELAKGETYIPLHFSWEARELERTLVPVGEKKMPLEMPEFFKKKLFETGEDALNAGKVTLDDPGQIMFRYMQEAGEYVNQMDLVARLTPLEAASAVTAREGMAAARDSYRRTSAQAGYMAKALIGLFVGETTAIPKSSGLFPDIVERLKVMKGMAIPFEGNASVNQWLESATAAHRAAREGVERASDAITAMKQGRQIATGYGGEHLENLRNLDTWFARGLWFEKGDLAKVASHLKSSADIPPILGAVGEVANFTRTTMLGGDFGSWFIQNILLLSNDPGAWGKSVADSFKTALDSRAMSRYTAKNADLISRIPQLVVGENDLMSPQGIASIGRWSVEHLGVLGEPVKQLLEGTIGRFQNAFIASGLVARVEWAKALAPIVERRGGDIADLGTFLNAATGVSSLSAMGLPASQRMLEGTLLLLAPRYTRSALALVGEAMRGTISGQIARESLGRMLFVGPYLYSRFARAMGQEPRMDPSKGDFLTVEIGDQVVGIGSIWRNMARLVAKLAEDPGSAARHPWAMEGTNPLIDFWRSRAAPVSDALWTMTAGEDFAGNKLGSIGDVLAYAGSRVFPFAIVAGFEERGHGVPSVATAVLSQAVGFNVRSKGFRQVANRVAREKFGKDYEGLDPWQSAEVQYDARVRATSLPSGWRFESARQQRGVLDKYEQDVNDLAEDVLNGKLTQAQFRQRLGESNQDRSVAMGVIEKQFPGAPVTEERAMLDRFFAIRSNKNLTLLERQEAAEEYLASLPEHLQTIIKEPPSTARYSPHAQELIVNLRKARRVLEPYWNLRKEVYTDAGLWDVFKAAPPRVREELEKLPEYKFADSKVEFAKRKMRWQRSDVDEALVTHYGLVPVRQQRL